jgi:hypothetical protein
VSPERVVQAAVRLRGSTFTGQSHKVGVWIAADRLGLATSTVWTEAERGFLTSLGRFVSRAEAWKVAKRAGQLRWDKSRPGVTPELHSEDLR